MSKYIVAVDHRAGYGKSWSYLKLGNTDKAMAFAEAAVKGFKQEQVFCLVILKRIKKNTYTALVRIYPDGNVNDITNETWVDNWIVCDSEFVKENK